MKTDLSFIYTIIESHINVCKEHQNLLRSDETELSSYFDGSIEALEHVKETIKSFIKATNRLVEKQ